MLPILHLNGYKIANPTVLARIPEHELRRALRGLRLGAALRRQRARRAACRRPPARFAAALDDALDEIARSRRRPARGDATGRPRWPMIVLRTPKGWTGPREVDGVQVEGTGGRTRCRSRGAREDAEHRRMLEEWLRSYRPEELFDDDGRLRAELRALAPQGERRMSANPHANGGQLLHELVAAGLPRLRRRGRDAGARRSTEPTRKLGAFLRDVIVANPTTFRLFGPDETASNRLGDVFEVTDRAWDAETEPTDDHLAPGGRVMEVLSEHQCQGWLEGYLLTGRHGLFNCYEAFIHIVDSMFNQHAKWLKVTRDDPVAPARRVTQLPAQLARLAPGSQRLLASGSRLHRPRGQQEGGGHPRLPAAGREHAPVGRRSLPALAATT